jgi:hypothetical protein
MADMELPAADTIIELLISEDFGVSQVAPGPHGASMPAFLVHPRSMIGSDSVFVGESPSPRSYGTFPRVLGEFVREERLLSLEDAVRKMTSLPANRLGLVDRGLLKDGFYADLARRVREEIEAGASGVVVTHGTDTLEETVYALRTLLPCEVPVVLMGSMRGADSPESVGPRNLRAALTAAAEPALADHGAVVVMQGEIHAAGWVRKVHTSRLDAFASLGHGPIGRVSRDRVWLLADPDPRTPCPSCKRPTDGSRCCGRSGTTTPSSSTGSPPRWTAW